MFKNREIRESFLPPNNPAIRVYTMQAERAQKFYYVILFNYCGLQSDGFVRNVSFF